MTAFAAALQERLTTHPTSRWGAASLLLTGVALAIAWPTRAGVANDAWVAVATVRALLIAALALGHGVALGGLPRREGLASAAAVVVFAIAGLPLERLAYAGSGGGVGAAWAWGWTIAAALGHLAIGALLGAVLGRMRLRVLAPVFVLAYLVGVVVAAWRGWIALDPIGAALGVTPWPMAIWLAIAVAAAATWLGVGWRRR
jgi:hypothetical protein